MLNPSSLRRIKKATICKVRSNDVFSFDFVTSVFSKTLTIQGFRFSSTYPAFVDVGNGTVSSVRNVRVASSPVEGDASSVSVWVNSGTIHENREQLGSSNLLRAVLTSVCYLHLFLNCILYSYLLEYRKRSCKSWR